jgi:tetrathionate reductase subunit B
VYYLNIPKRFIAGTVYDPVEKEVVIGATVTATYDAGAVTVETDEFGDFWLKGLDTGDYAVSITADGFAKKAFDAVSLDEDVNLGDIPLTR